MINQKFIRISDAQDIIGCSRTTIHRMIKDGSFPKPVTLRNRQIRFVASEVDVWMKGKIESGRKASKLIIHTNKIILTHFGVLLHAEDSGQKWPLFSNTVIGGLLFGFGIVLAGGCETGWMYRAVEGQVHYWWVGLGNVIGSTILAYFWDDLSPVLATNWDKVNLLNTFGPLGGLLVTYALLLVAFLLVIAQEKRFFRRAALKTDTQENVA